MAINGASLSSTEHKRIAPLAVWLTPLAVNGYGDVNVMVEMTFIHLHAALSFRLGSSILRLHTEFSKCSYFAITPA